MGDRKLAELILGLETSCDETSASVIADGRKILSNVISSQVQMHQMYGGVVPELASRQHLENVVPVIDEALKQAGAKFADLTAVGVTYGPGLVGALLVGVAAAKALAYAIRRPLIGVHHVEAHVFANFLAHSELEPPFIALVASGGHTSLLHIRNYDDFTLVGQTRDDAAGEAFDKVARLLGLPYPGGPHVELLARSGSPDAIAFPRAFSNGAGYEFSFSGLKSAVINYIHTAEQRRETVNKADVAASFQLAVVDVLVEKTCNAAMEMGVHQVVLAGGVAANSFLSHAMEVRCAQLGLSLFFPPPVLCTDNAAMVGCRAYYKHRAGEYSGLALNAIPYLVPGR